MVTDRRWRALGAAVTTTALLVSASAPSVAQEGEDAPALSCEGGELLDDSDGEPFLLVEPGATITCTAAGLDPEAPSELIVDFFGFTDDEDLSFEDGGDEEPSSTEVQDLEPGVDTFSFAVPGDLVIGDFEGVLFQGDPEEPSYEAFFGGFIFGDFLAGMACAPDPVEVGAEVTCDVDEFTEGPFTWEVYLLTVDELIEAVFGEGELDDPDAEGEAQADGGGVGSFAFTAGEGELYLAIADQGMDLAFYAGEIVPAADDGGAAPAPQPPVEEAQPGGPETAPAAPVAPTRVDAGEGPVGPGPLSLLLLAAVGGLLGVSATRLLPQR